MFNWICGLFMSTTADAALEVAIYSAGLASTSGMHQPEEPENLQAVARKYRK
ncbi:MAG: cyclic lactone autoinducer peptide [Clostridiales bacterium]|nr:cyclic lactone autoinducer peptide [Clostridiales bacterium]